MFVVGFLVLFAGVVSSVLAAASTSILLSFILPVALPGGPAAIPDRLLGWLLAGAVSLPAVTLLWPAPRSEPLRAAAAEACRQLSARLTAEVAHMHGEEGEDVEAAVARSDAAVAALRATFLATPYRPSGLTTATRAVVRLVDELVWLSVILDNAAAIRRRPADPTVREVKSAAAVLLDHAGRELSLGRAAAGQPPRASRRPRPRTSRDGGDRSRRWWSRRATPASPTSSSPRSARASARRSSRTPSRRSRRTSRSPRRPSGARGGASCSVGNRGATTGRSPRRRSARSRMWSCTRCGCATASAARSALAGAVLIADLSGAQHSFWIVLGALSVLRSNALSTGQNAVRGLVGTTIGFVIGGILVVLVGTNHVLLWSLLPVAILAAGIAPAVSFTAGQAGFTVTLLILFNIISPAGWEVGLVRIEDVAIGCAVSLVVGTLFWPRGATGLLRRALTETYTECAAYLRTAVETATAPGASPVETQTAATRAAAAGRRLDDAFREYLAERGRKHLSLAEVASLLTGVAGLRLTAQAVSDLWSDTQAARIDVPRAQLEVIVLTERVTNWFAAMAHAMTSAGTVPRALARDGTAGGRLVEALAEDLGSRKATDAAVRAQTVRLVWTSDHVDTARRLQALVEQPARAAAD